MGHFLNQTRHVIRRLLRAPLFTGVTLLTLGVGIGANTAIFSVLRGVLLKALPYSRPEELVAIWESAPGLNIGPLNAAPSTYFTFREEGRTFQKSGLWRGDTVSVTGLAEPEEVPCLFVTEDTLPVLDVQPMLGRGFTHKDDSPGSPETVILTYGYWQRKFGGDASALGRRILLDGKAREVIGVMPQNFRFMDTKAVVILPLQIDRSTVFLGHFSYQAMARLKPGVTLAQANADVARMIPLMMTKFPPPPGMNLRMFEAARLGPDVHPLKDDVVGDIGKVLWVLMATVGIVLLIACANVANLLLVRADGRQHELAIRAALGASWMRVARELLLESLMLGLAGGALGLGLAYGGLRALVAMGPANLPRLEEIAIDAPAILFAFGLSLLTGILFGLVPVFKYAGPRVGLALRQGGRNASGGRERHRLRSVLVVVQVALALVLLVSSGLMIRTIRALRQVQPGFTDPAHILTLRVAIPKAQVPEDERVVRMQDQIRQKIAAIPGVTSVGLANSVTLDGNNGNDPVFAEDRLYSEGQIPPLRRYKFISPGYFQAMGNPLVAGRDLTWTDLYEARSVVLVSENLARELWGTPAAAIGKRVRETHKAPWREVVGVAGNDHDDGLNKKEPTTIYWPLIVKGLWGNATRTQRDVAFAVRSNRAGSLGFFDQVQRAVWSENPNLTIASVRTMQELYDRSMARTSFVLVMLTIAAGMALLLGVIGIYGVISYSISQRTREIGIRMALGAQQQTVKKMFLAHALRLTAVGVGCGLAVAFAITRLMSALLFGVKAVDPITYVAVPLILSLAAMFASYVPARKAVTIEPVEALRAE